MTPALFQCTWAGVNKVISNLDPSEPKPQLKLCRFVHPIFAQLMAEYLVAQVRKHATDLFYSGL